ncbi:hypothetical protein [Enterobacter roggenkampii]|uniref:hypothetical protein n=1 Tax=Enterobacter roggenkampii TaxID=1812935 RepID=UPI001F28C1EA|nr:hypothetical protein [Enterobacter roggenkampii]MCE5964802.1 hypothetical protein [Enterobacter roggenkampii]MCE5969235.1 hypothetical protein [Enterobacter roggenkampii]UHY21033.1 hypothetical protein LL005_13355 [Enterobacter roggenkampii]
MSSKYEDLIKNARINADCGEHMSPEEVTTLLNVVETTFAALAAENAGLKAAHPQPFGPEMMKALDAYEKHQDETPETGMLDAFFIMRDSIRVDTTTTDAFLAEVRAQGVEMLNTQFKKCTGMLYADSVVSTAEHFADQLRKGVQS